MLFVAVSADLKGFADALRVSHLTSVCTTGMCAPRSGELEVLRWNIPAVLHQPVLVELNKPSSLPGCISAPRPSG